jgi:AcrR family transcriptional regulator
MNSRRLIARRPNDRHQLALRAAAAVIARRGVEQTRYRDISDESGVPVATLQYMFGSLENLVVEAMVDAADVYRAQTAQLLGELADPAQRMRLFVDRIIGTESTDRRRWRVWLESWYTSLRDPSARERMARNGREWEELLTGILTTGRDAGLYRPDLDPRAAALQIFGMVDGLGIALILRSEEPDLAGMRALLIDAIQRLLH